MGTPPSGGLGYLGDKERFSTGGNADLMRMGVRLYDPALGRFLETDPVPGGSANDYDYCSSDPINCFDPLGTRNYTYTFNLGPGGSPESLKSFVIQHCSTVFPLAGCQDNFVKGQHLALVDRNSDFASIKAPVEIYDITATSFTFRVLKGTQKAKEE